MRTISFAALSLTSLMALCAIAAQALPTDFERKDWVAGFNSPEAMKFAPDGRLFVLEQAGKIRIVKNGTLLATPFAAVTTWAHRESMLGVAFDPKFAQNGYVYIYYQSPKHQNRISRLTASKDNPDIADANSELVLLDGIGDAGYQGGAFFFGKDGMLYAGSAHPGAQDPNSLSGKALRLDPSAYPNIIPADNPFVGKAGYRGEIYAMGFREPFTGAADMVTGDMVFNDVGDGGFEEVDLLKPGANYGYENGCEGDCAKAGMQNPLLAYSHAVGNCITGATFYEAATFPAEYKGSLFYADWGASWIKRRTPDGKVVDFDASGKVIQLDVGPDGSLYLLQINGENIPWTGSVQKVRYTGAVGIRPLTAAGYPASIGPESAVVRSRDGSVVRFRLGQRALREADLEVFDERGHSLSVLHADHPGSILAGTIPSAPGSRFRFYVLRLLPVTGPAMEKQGKLLFLD